MLLSVCGSSIRSQCESHSTIREQGLLFVEVIKQLLQRLLEYRAILNDENKENRMSCTVNLLVGLCSGQTVVPSTYWWVSVVDRQLYRQPTGGSL